jgi:hypothetical protein
MHNCQRKFKNKAGKNAAVPLRNLKSHRVGNTQYVTSVMQFIQFPISLKIIRGNWI